MIKYLKHINWNNDDINNTILFLFSLRISMVDNGEETDSFFHSFFDFVISIVIEQTKTLPTYAT